MLNTKCSCCDKVEYCRMVCCSWEVSQDFLVSICVYCVVHHSNEMYYVTCASCDELEYCKEFYCSLPDCFGVDHKCRITLCMTCVLHCDDISVNRKCSIHNCVLCVDYCDEVVGR